MSSDLVVQVFARYPRPGQVKSRLVPTLGEQASYELQLAMLDDLLGRLAVCCNVELWGTESEDLPHYQRMLGICGGHFQLQRGNDLGERMQFAVDSALQRSLVPVLVGADCPQIDCAVLAQIESLLDRGTQAVMVPANDGGYVALALTCSHDSLFRDIEWGTDVVAGKTRAAMQRAGIQYDMLAEQVDIDNARDLALLETLSMDDNPALYRWLQQYRSLY
jgi:rSAM/selenodomain-associated transferase 1